MINTDFEEYLEKYCRKHGISKEEAKKHWIVEEYRRWKEAEENGAQTRIRSSQIKLEI